MITSFQRFLIFEKNTRMKKTLLFLGVVLFNGLHAQVTITSNDMPNGGDLLLQQNATLIGAMDLEESGTNLYWTVDENFLTLTGQITSTDCQPISNAPFTYQIFFNSPMDAEHNSDYAIIAAGPAIPLDQLPIPIPITIEDTYQFYQTRSDRYALTGFGATISGFPTGAAGNPVDVIYPLPLTYGLTDQTNSYFQYDIPSLGTYTTAQTRNTQVMAWGTMNFFGQEYPVLKVRSEIAASDSLYVSQFNIGFPFDRPLAVEYKWLTPGIKVPLLQINTTAGAQSGVLVYQMPSAVAESQDEIAISAYPNPMQESLYIKGIQNLEAYEIFDGMGKVVLKGNMSPSQRIDVSGLASGVYHIQVAGQKIKCVK